MSYRRFTFASVALVLTAAVSAQGIKQLQGLSRMSITADTDSAWNFAVGDVNRDGAPDYFIANLNTSQSSKLYINDGNGNFSDRSGALLPANVPGGGAAVMGDIDGDGDLDIIHGTMNSALRLQVFLNDGRGKFSDASKNIAKQPAELFYDLCLGDVDFDKDLDLLCAASGSTGNSRLFLNDGSGKFTDITGTARFPNPGGAHWGCAFFDLKRDVDLDILLVSAAPKIYENTNFKGTFKEVSTTVLPSGFSAPRATKAVVGDVNGDGWADIFFAKFGQDDLLLWDIPSKRFKKVTATHLPVTTGSTYQPAIADMDLDGDLDIVTAIYSAAGVQNLLYLNDGKGKFSNGTMARFAPINDSSTAITVADVDQDGDVDVIVGNWAKNNQVVFNIHRHVYAPAQPAINTAYTLDFYGAPGYTQLPQVIIPLMGLAEAKPHFSIGGFRGKLGIPLAGLLVLPTIPLRAPGGKFSAKFTVPNNQALKGVKLFLQSLMAQPPNPVAGFANLFVDQIR